MANSGLYQGNALQGVDAKGRVAIPARFRDVIQRNAEGPDASTLIVTRHPDLPCLRAYDASWSHLRHERIDDREVDAEDGKPYERQKERDFGAVDTPTFDSAGRFFLHGLLKRRAKIADLAFFIGAGRTFNIWSPELLLSSDADAEAREWCEYLMETRGAKA
ncbi:division/cell wall cluster transcriptional repressor MraZ [Sphingomonas sp.]|uniref:division/cell wall cluster transcriptional repressor MraZ n=1 Tax=Sphingomonas sp. TaxID=28214 RepID=UPI002DD697F1|nr:division/cell wall cluster transcriptional repressor MraZ [Sphingomonas sp.]